MATRQRSKPKNTGTHTANGHSRARKPRASRSNGNVVAPMLDGMADGIMNRIKNLSDEAVHAADAGVRGIRKSAGTYLKAGRKSAGRMERSVEHRIEERPIMAILAASIVGFFLGIIFSRR